MVRFCAIRRPRLDRSLTQTFEAGTQLLVAEAPAGYGKTTAVAQWARQVQDTRLRLGQSTDILWLGARDNRDPVRLWAKLEERVALSPTTVIIDDYGGITTFDIDQQLLQLLETNPGLRVVLLTRKRTTLTNPLATTRVRVTLLDAVDFEFTDGEVSALEQQLLQGAHPRTEEMTVGVGRWPVAVHAGLLALQQGSSPTQFAADLAEGLLKVTPDLLAAQILVASARVPHVAIQNLADTLGFTQSQVRSSQQSLQELGAMKPAEAAGSNLGLPPPSTVPFLITQAGQLWDKESLADLLELTARQHEAKNPGQAFRSHVEEGRIAQATEVLRHNFMTILDEGAGTISVLRTVPLELLDDHPEMLMAPVILERTDNAHPIEAVEELAARLRMSVRNAMAAATEQRMLLLQIFLVATERMLGNWEEARRLSIDFMKRSTTPGLRPTKKASDHLATMYSVVALTACLMGEEELAREAATWGLQDARRAENPIEVAHNLGLLASADILAGDLSAAAHNIAEMDEVLASNGVELREFSWVDGEVSRASLLTNTGDLVGAKEALDNLSPYVDRMEQWPLVVLSEADYFSSADNEAAGLTALENRIRHKPEYRQLSDYWRFRVLEWEANANIFVGHLSRAADLVTQMDPDLPQTQAAALRLDLMRKNFGDVTETVRETDLEAMELVPRLRMLLYGAVAATKVGDWEFARIWWEAFAQYVDVAPQWFFSLAPFEWMEGSLLQTLEHASEDRALSVAGLRSVQSRLRSTQPSHRMLYFEPLTPAEQDVLKELATGAPVTTMADNLFLSVNTVKFHLRSVYRKLHVSKREDAVRRGKQIGVV